MTPLGWGRIGTPLGPMIAVLDPRGAVVRLDFEDDSYREEAARILSGDADPEATAHVARQMTQYFRGERRSFDLALAPRGSAFMQRVWRTLGDTPYGATLSYGELARRMDPPTSARAIGRANALNPISIIIPCHRILAAGGHLTGYSAGLGRKQALLALEAERRLPIGRSLVGAS